MRFDWNPAKDEVNFKKHGVSFKTAITAFDDPYALVAAAPSIRPPNPGNG
jgi:uncharacterized DUF497 family protein